MAITTADQLEAGLRPVDEMMFKDVLYLPLVDSRGHWRSPAFKAGSIPAATAPATAPAGEVLTSWPGGQLAFPPPVGGQSVYLARFEAYSEPSGGIDSAAIFDRLWHSGPFVDNVGTAQTVDSVAWPNRDRLGTSDGEGLVALIEYPPGTQPTTGVAFQMTYTNSAGVTGRTATMPAAGTSAQESVDRFYLQAGDTGIRSIQSIQNVGTVGAATNITLWVGRKIVHVPLFEGLSGTDVPNARRDALALGLPKCWEGTVPVILYRGAGAGVTFLGVHVRWAQG